MSTNAAQTKREQKRNEWPRVRQVSIRGELKWRVDARLAGKGKRYFYDTVGDADKKAAKLRDERENEGKESITLDDRLKEQLAAVGATLKDAVAFYLKHAKPISGEKKVSAVIDEFIAAKAQAGRSKEYVGMQGYTLKNVFGKEGKFGPIPIHKVSASEIEKWLHSQKWGLRTCKNYHGDLSNFFGFAVRRGYLSINPMAQIEKPTPKPKPPGILTPAQAGDVLTAACAGNGEMLPAVAIGLFCGIRSAELERLEWQHVRLTAKTIEVTAENAKTSQRRIVDMPDNLMEWLTPYVKTTGRIAPHGFAYALGKCASAAKIDPWPRNAMRHSFASYHLAHHKNAALTASQLGHFGSTRTLVNCYRDVVQPSEAAAFWKIAPQLGKVIAFKRENAA